MNLTIYKAIAAGFLFIVSVIAIIYPLQKKRLLQHSESFELGEAFASGVFLGAGLLHLLPDSIRLLNERFGSLSYPVAELIALAGFLLLLFFERLALANNKSGQTLPYLLTFILVVHALVEGAALGIGVTLSETLILFIAIVAHKGSETYALCVTLLRSSLSYQRTLTLIIFFSLMTPLGIFLGNFVNSLMYLQDGLLVAGIFNAFAAGTFLYISTLHHVHFHHHEGEAQGMAEYGCLVLGVVMMAAIAFYA